MAGFLDGKSRIIDIVLTKEGRRKVSQGLFRPSFVSFSDSGVDYESSGLNFGTEAASNPADVLTVEASENGYLLTSGNGLDSTGGMQILPSGEELDATTAFDKLQETQTQAFGKLSILQTVDAADGQFKVSPTNLKFVLGQNETASGAVNIDSFPGMFEDKRFRGVKNFMYLPPVNKLTPDQQSLPLGNYPDSIEDLGSKSLQQVVSKARQEGKSKSVEFGYKDTLQARQQSDLLVQVYELENNKSIRKMDVYDLGFLEIDGRKRVYVAGYEERDSKNVSTFLGVFYFLVT